MIMRAPVLQQTVPVSFPPEPMPRSTGPAVKYDPAVIEALPFIQSRPPDLLQKPASAVPSDTSVQVCLPSNLQEQSPPKYTPPDEMTLSAMQSTQLVFSTGFAVDRITTCVQS